MLSTQEDKKPQSKTSFTLVIPTEIINFALSFLSVIDVFNLSLTNKTFHQMLVAYPKATALPDSIIELVNLCFLNLSNCQITDKDLYKISSLNQLRQLSISGSRFITDSGMKMLSALSNLSSIYLSNCSEISGDILEYNFIKKLRHLNLSGCFRVTEDKLIKLADSNIKKLNLSRNKLCKPLKYLHNLTGLEELDLSHNKDIENKDIIDYIKYFISLRVLNLHNVLLFNGECLEAVALLPKLSEFFTNSEFIEDKHLLSFLHKTTLTTLAIRRNNRILHYTGRRKIIELYNQLTKECFALISKNLDFMPDELRDTFLNNYVVKGNKRQRTRLQS